MKKFLLIFIATTFSFCLLAQNSNDIAIITNANWATKQIDEAIVFKQAQLNIFNSKQSISVLEIAPNQNIRLGINDVSDTLISTSGLCKNVDAIAGINASFFDTKQGGAVDFVRVDGEIKHHTKKQAFNNAAALVIHKNRVEIIERDSTQSNWAENIAAENVIVAGPLIMKNGECANIKQTKFNTNRHPRTFVATKPNGTTLFVVVDGRNSKAAGMSIQELYILAKALGCTNAMNFDGGGSSAMYINGEGENGIVNYPSDNRLFDHKGERKVANVIYAKKHIPFKFALLTDTHIGTATAEEDLIRCIDDINSQNDIDFVLINGDLTEHGLNSEIEHVKKLLDKLNKKYYAIAGNHETKWTESGHTRFAQVFGSNNVAFEHKGIQFIGFSSGPVLKMGDAHVSPNEIEWIKHKLLEVENKNQAIIVFTHVPLVEPHDQIDNGHQITDMLRQHNVRAILNGHYHLNRALDADGIPAIICRSSLRAKQNVGGYTIFRIDDDSIKVYEKNPIEKTQRQWHSLSMKKKYYTSEAPTHNLGNDSINALYPNVNIKWQYPTGGIIVNTAAVDQNRVIVGNELGDVYCLNVDNGELIWNFKARNAVYSAPAIDKNKVVFGSCDSTIYCLDINNGNKIWDIKTKHTVMGAPIIENDIAYIGGSDGSFRAIDISQGHVIWEFDKIKGYIESKPLIYENKIIFGAWDTNLYALNKTNGTLAWKWNNGRTQSHFSPAACIPVAAHGKVFIVAPDRYMTALDAKTGEIVWRTNKHKVRETIGISEDSNRIYARCFVDTLFCVSSTDNEFKEIWHSKTGYTYDINPSMPIEKDEVVFFVTKNGMFVACDAQNGEILWKHKFKNTIIATVTPINKNELIFTTHDGIIGRLINKEKK